MFDGFGSQSFPVAAQQQRTVIAAAQTANLTAGQSQHLIGSRKCKHIRIARQVAPAAVRGNMLLCILALYGTESCVWSSASKSARCAQPLVSWTTTAWVWLRAFVDHCSLVWVHIGMCKACGLCICKLVCSG